ncbi:MAG: hypothetical protein HXY28_08290 [Hydrogenophilaceae bacterium]|jgi:hypothetical protein|nr:hypothetical protein [Hydrogenophilaceae bacterium]
MPTRLTAARCAAWRPASTEYFKRYAEGRFDEKAQAWLILPREHARLDEARGALVIGSAGVDGITFCLRKGLAGVWAYYPHEDEFQIKATSLEHLERGWADGTIWV